MSEPGKSCRLEIGPSDQAPTDFPGKPRSSSAPAGSLFRTVAGRLALPRWHVEYQMSNTYLTWRGALPILFLDRGGCPRSARANRVLILVRGTEITVRSPRLREPPTDDTENQQGKQHDEGSKR
jgi:hypothetical protein